MQPELGLHVDTDEQLRTRNLPVSESRTVRFKMKLETPRMLPRCLNDDRSRECFAAQSRTNVPSSVDTCFPLTDFRVLTGRGQLHVQKEERAPRPAKDWQQQLVGGGSSHFEVPSHQETPSFPSIRGLSSKFLEEWKALLQDLGEVKWRSSEAARIVDVRP
ncbi:hypothetical protein LR48_Vigan10g262800 [Vigna angularis]|uniref:Uncharacterized protein n=1 Tax=Phaseolus angularis TaxID=3914 RepID=A0A0L9VNU1_PHAAN|nr:hypothetical protein LR48_Vigan10g262800 [Vigna angularis]